MFAKVGAEGELSGPVLIGDANSLDKVTRLYFQLSEQPLSDKHEVSGTLTTEVQYEYDPEWLAGNPAAQAAAFALAEALGIGPIEWIEAPAED